MLQNKLSLGVATFRFKLLFIFDSLWVRKQIHQSFLRNSKALGLTTVRWRGFLLKISNRYYQLPPLQLTGEVFVGAWPSSPAKDLANADRDRKGHDKEPFTIWGCRASTKGLVSANAETDGGGGRTFCSAVELQLGMSHWKLDLHLWTWSWLWKTEKGAGTALTPVLLLVMALITAFGHDHVFVIVCLRFL